MAEKIKIRKKAMLLVSEECNLNCVYCYEKYKNPGRMSFETAKKILDDFYSETRSGDTTLIEVFGGEAFTNFALIKQIDDYVMSRYGDRTNLFETTTNGTLVHGKIQNWLRERKDRYDITVSLDGTREMQDANRPFLSGDGTFNSIDLDFFLDTWEDAQAKMTMSEKTLPKLAEGIIYIHELGFICDATLSTGIDWDFEKNRELFTEQLNILVKYYSENPDIKLCTMLNYDLRLVFSKLKKGHRFCGACELTTCYDIRGNKYPCQGFAPVSIGEKSELFRDYDESKLNLMPDNPCVKCQFFFMCANCYSANYVTTGCTHLVDVNLCEAYRLCILASSKIQFNRLLKKNVFSDDDRLVLKAIQVIQHIITTEESPLVTADGHVCDANNRCC